MSKTKEKKVNYQEIITKNNEKNAENIKNCGNVERYGVHKYMERPDGYVVCSCGRILSINEEKNKKWKKDFEKWQKEQKDKSEEVKEEVKEEVEKSWVDSLDYSMIYSVSGQKFLMTPFGQRNKSGMILMLEFMDTENRRMVNHKHISKLSSYVFYTTQEKNLRIEDVFTNIDDNYDTIKSIMEDGLIKESLNLFVPNYDENKFHTSHAKKVWNWFNEIKSKVEEFVEEGETEMAAEENE